VGRFFPAHEVGNAVPAVTPRSASSQERLIGLVAIGGRRRDDLDAGQTPRPVHCSALPAPAWQWSSPDRSSTNPLLTTCLQPVTKAVTQQAQAFDLPDNAGITLACEEASA
jgi:hypothetical protein